MDEELNGDGNVDIEELSKLVSNELDKLVGERMQKFDESLKDFGQSINNFHKVLMETRKDAERMLENERQQRLEQEAMERNHLQQEEQQTLENNFVHNNNNNNNNTNRKQRNNNKLGISKSVPSLGSQSMASPSKIRHIETNNFQQYKNHIRRRNSPKNLKPIS